MAICCPILLLGIPLFLETEQARHLNEQLFARYYTGAMVLMPAFYGAIGLCLALVGLTLGVIAFVRRETPIWLPWLALTVNALVQLAALIYLTGR